MWRSNLKLDLQCFSYLLLEPAFIDLRTQDTKIKKIKVEKPDHLPESMCCAQNNTEIIPRIQPNPDTKR